MNALILVAVAPSLALTGGAATPTGRARPAWPQWGGPNRNFVVDTPPIATTWPADGPRRLWQRPLGDGFSAIVTDGTTLYTLYRDGSPRRRRRAGRRRRQDHAGRRATRRRSRRPARSVSGRAPRAAPVVAGDRLITVSAGGLMNSFDRRNRHAAVDARPAGRARPRRVAGVRLFVEPDRLQEHGYHDGRRARGAAWSRSTAATGAVTWQAQDFDNGYSSPS